MTIFKCVSVKGRPLRLQRSAAIWFFAASLLAPSLVLASTPLNERSTPEEGVIRIVMSTQQGPITIDLFTKQAPISAANFLRYVDSGLLNGATFYRAVRLDNQRAEEVPIQVIQGGLAARPKEPGQAPSETFPPIAHESTAVTGITHGPGTISMARAAPGTATSEFFISVGNNPQLDAGGKRNPDGLGFAAFGRVVQGMEVVHHIQNASTAASREMDLGVMRGQLLDELVEICKVFRVSSEVAPDPSPAPLDPAAACPKK